MRGWTFGRGKVLLPMKVKPLPPVERDASVLEHCKRSISVADMCRRSGSPEVSLWILRSVFPMLLMLIRSRWSSKLPASRHPQALLDSLHSASRIDTATYTRLREATVGLGEYGNGSDVRHLIDACRLLLTLAQSNVFDDVEDERPIELVSVPAKPSRMRRLATTAASLVSIGGA